MLSQNHCWLSKQPKLDSIYTCIETYCKVCMDRHPPSVFIHVVQPKSAWHRFSAHSPLIISVMEKKALQKSPLMSVIHEEWDCFEPRLWLNKMVNCSKWGRTKDRLSSGNFLFFVLTSDLHLILVKLQPHLNMMNNLTYWLHRLEFKLFCGATESCVRA